MEKLVKAGTILISWLVLFQAKCLAQSEGSNNGIEHLTSIPDFRSVKLKWIFTSSKDPLGFFITLCEIIKTQDSCFERHLFNKKSGTLLGHDSLWTDGHGHFEAVVHDLRMLSKYTAKVEPMDPAVFAPMVRMKGAHRIQGYQHNSASTSFTTRGFSAYATNCRSNSSEIVVHTGPHFGGKIAVDERSADSKCSVYGNRSSSQDTYVLKINHSLCGSKTVNNSRIDTVVVVHESSSVVTHNSRRFMVQCSFLPDTFTIKASFNIPTDSEEPNNLNYRQLEEAVQNVDSNDVFTYEHYKQNHVKDSRMSSVPGPTVLQKNISGYESQMLVLLVVVIVLVILVVIVIGLGLWWYINSHKRGSNNMDIETLSTSGSSVMAYHHGTHEPEDEGLVRHPMAHQHALFNDPYSCYHARNMNSFCAGQVALVSLKPVKELY